MNAYADIVQDRARLFEVLDRLPLRLVGRERLAHWRALAEAGDFEALAYELMEGHYDPAYDRSSRKDQRPVLGEVRIAILAPSGQEAAADTIAALVADDALAPRKFS